MKRLKKRDTKICVVVFLFFFSLSFWIDYDYCNSSHEFVSLIFARKRDRQWVSVRGGKIGSWATKKELDVTSIPYMSSIASFKSITMLCGIDSIPRNILGYFPHSE